MVAYLGGIAERLNRGGGRGVIEQVEFVQCPIGHAQRVFHRRRAARHGKVGEVRESLEIGSVREQNLAAPNAPVVTVARAIESNSNGRLIEAAFGHGAYDVRVMVLDFLKGQLFACVGCAAMGLFGPFRREVFGVHVGRKAFGRGLEQALEMLFCRKPRVECLGVFHVANMLAHERFVAAQQAERILLLGACGEQHTLCLVAGLVALLRKRNWHGREPARAAHHLHGVAGAPRRNHAHDRIVETAANGAVVAQKRVGDACELGARLVIGHANGLIVQIARRHDERSAERGKQQVLHRRIWQHNAQFGKMVGEACGELRVVAFLQEHDGSLRAREQAAFGVVDLAGFTHIVERAIHNRECFAFAALAAAQLGEGFGVARIACQMEAAKAFHGDDGPFMQKFGRARENRIAGLKGATPQRSILVSIGAVKSFVRCGVFR